MASILRTRNRQVAVLRETVPGVVESGFSAADVLFRPHEDLSVSLDPDLYNPGELVATGDEVALSAGRTQGTMLIPYNVRGPGNLTDDPAVKLLLESSMFVQYSVKKIAIGTISDGPFRNMATFSAAPSGATGVIWRDTADGASDLRYYPLAGTVADGDTITQDGGGTQPSCAASGSPADDGKLYRQRDSGFLAPDTLHHLSVWINLDGTFQVFRGCLSELEIAFTAGRPALFRHNFQGILADEGDQATFDMSGGFPEDAVVRPRFSNNLLKFGGYSPRGVPSMTLRVPVNLSPDEDATDTNEDGIRYTTYRRSAPLLTLEPNWAKKATFPMVANMKAGTSFAVTWRLGKDEGSIWDFYMDTAQFTQANESDRDGRATVSNEIRAHGTNDNSLFIWQH